MRSAKGSLIAQSPPSERPPARKGRRVAPSGAAGLESLPVADYISSHLLKSLRVAHAFSLRTGGVSPPPFDSLNLGRQTGDDESNVLANERLFLQAAGILPEHLLTARQVHGDSIVHASFCDRRVEARSAPDAALLSLDETIADALVASGGAAVGVRTADCVPILLHDPVSGISAAVHAGWRGTVALIAVKTIDALAAVHGVDPKNVRASIGPSIGACCFEVGEEVVDAFRRLRLDAVVHSSPPGKARVDLQAANRLLLRTAGLRPAHVEVIERCTHCDAESFFSHRRDEGRTGRHLSVIASQVPGQTTHR